MIDRLAQVIGLRRLTHLNRRVTGLCHPGRSARLGFAQLGGGIQTRCRPEALMKLAILRLQTTELHRLEQRQSPGGNGKNHQQPDHRTFDGFQWRGQ